MPDEGPVTIFKLNPNWNTNLQVFGLNTAIRGPLVGTQDYLSGHTITCTHCTFNSDSTSVTMCKNCTLLNSSTHNQEIDKNIENFTMSDTMLDGNLTFQSPTPSNGVFTRVTTTGRLSGWPLNGKFTDHEVIAWAVPGFQYAFANLDGTLNSVPKTSFTINDVTDQGTSIKIWTTLPNVLPTPSCDGTPCPMLQPYAGGVITQTPPGVPTDLTQFAPPQ
jgi:hypothetical protein